MGGVHCQKPRSGLNWSEVEGLISKIRRRKWLLEEHLKMVRASRFTAKKEKDKKMRKAVPEH